jgi:dTDP-4-dehydrorhamnose 3,5-epimerase
MKFVPTKIEGVWIIEMERHHDERGWFARTWCKDEFSAQGIGEDFVQCSSSFNLRRGTLRGMHYQAAPHEEAKVVRCIRGAIYDVALDLREGSPTFRQWTALELTADNGLALYIPKGCAHGFQTLADNTEVFYQISTPWHPDSGRGVRWNDPAFRIEWPVEASLIQSERDRNYPLVRELTTSS